MKKQVSFIFLRFGYKEFFQSFSYAIIYKIVNFNNINKISIEVMVWVVL